MQTATTTTSGSTNYYKSPVSARFRADPRDRHPSSSASPPLNPIGVDTLDTQIQKIEELTEKLQSHRSGLNKAISQFLHSTTSDVRTLEETLTKLRIRLEPYKWRLERPKRYRMQIIISPVPAKTSTVTDKVSQFNEINTLCAETIKIGIELKTLIERFLTEAESKKKTYLAGDHLETEDRTAYLVAATRDLSRTELDRRISEFRRLYVNENNAKIIEQETNKTLLESRKLFYNLVRACAVCLV